MAKEKKIKLLILDNGLQLMGEIVPASNKSRIGVKRPIVIGKTQDKVLFDSFIDTVVSEDVVELFNSSLLAAPMELKEEMIKHYNAYWASVDKLFSSEEAAVGDDESGFTVTAEIEG